MMTFVSHMPTLLKVEKASPDLQRNDFHVHVFVPKHTAQRSVHHSTSRVLYLFFARHFKLAINERLKETIVPLLRRMFLHEYYIIRSIDSPIDKKYSETLGRAEAP